MFKQVELDFSFDALEPYIDTLTMETHYGKHHATYTKTFNNFLDEQGITGKTVEEILSSLDSITDVAARNGIRNNGGGYYNHNLYFANLSPAKGSVPTGEFADKVNEAFGSFEDMKAKLKALAVGQFGSGWAWLSVDKDGKLVASNSGNQDNPISLGTGNKPIFCLDVWEHAYYLKYKNLRPDYIDQFFNVVDWDKVAARYAEAVK